MGKLIVNIVVAVEVQHEQCVSFDEVAEIALRAVHCTELSSCSRYGTVHVREVSKRLQNENEECI